nr:hypothetical protein [Desulfobacterales bacterium]
MSDKRRTFPVFHPSKLLTGDPSSVPSQGTTSITMARDFNTDDVILNRYLFIGCCSCGGMGAVYRAYDRIA